MERIDISESELLEALQEAAGAEPDWGPADAHTSGELARAMETTREKVRDMLRPLVRSGKVRAVQVRRPALDGRLSRVPAYRFTGEQEGAAA